MNENPQNLTHAEHEQFAAIVLKQVSEFIQTNNPVFNLMANTIENTDMLTDADRAVFHSDLLNTALNQMGVFDVYEAALVSKLKESADGVKW